jgi:hypothetical protein
LPGLLLFAFPLSLAMLLRGPPKLNPNRAASAVLTSTTLDRVRADMAITSVFIIFVAIQTGDKLHEIEIAMAAVSMQLLLK